MHPNFVDSTIHAIFVMRWLTRCCYKIHTSWILDVFILAKKFHSLYTVLILMSLSNLFCSSFHSIWWTMNKFLYVWECMCVCVWWLHLKLKSNVYRQVKSNNNWCYNVSILMHHKNSINTRWNWLKIKIWNWCCW